MLKRIEVRSRLKAAEFVSEVPWAAISISSYNDWPELNSANRIGLLQLCFEDMEHNYKDYILFQDKHAEQIYEFASEMAKKVEIILVHCQAGISRSPAVAAVLDKAFLGGETKSYFDEYHPNKLVYKKMIQEGIRSGYLKYTDEFMPYVLPDDNVNVVPSWI